MESVGEVYGHSVRKKKERGKKGEKKEDEYRGGVGSKLSLSSGM